MNFDNNDFSAFERDMKRAVQDLCTKYQVKLKKMHISYGAVDFDMKLSFEKDEEGLNTERVKFEMACYHYGFVPDDYMRIFEYNDVEYELIGFDRSARKYNCIVREVETGIQSKINDQFLHDIFSQELQNAAAKHEKKSGIDESFLLTAEELSLLKLKLGKSKRGAKDWGQIKTVLTGKDMLTYIPTNPNSWIYSENGIAVEYGFLSVFTNKEALEKHLQELADDGRIGTTVSIAPVAIEQVIKTADEKRINVWFDITEEKNRGYYMYDAKERELKVVIM
ncbi:MAG: hypothetical protein MSA09_00215 [Lachnospiraceae bacterium]|nr:hypothetical protein [Lachnospiraceae bacterium]